MRKSIILIVLLANAVVANAQQVLKVGDTLKNLTLTSTKATRFDLDKQQAKGFILIFMTPSCDHCMAYEKRVMALDQQFKLKGFPVVAIGPYGDNEKDYPFDAMPAMKKLAEEKAFSFPYLADEKFKYTWLFDIRQTPKAVILKKIKNGYLVAYKGDIDNEPNEKKVPTLNFVAQEVNKLLNK